MELLQKYEKMFDGTLGKYTGFDYTIGLREDEKPYYTMMFLISNTQEPTLKKEDDGLIKIGNLFHFL